MNDDPSRRSVLRWSAVGLATGLAGCDVLDGGDRREGGPTAEGGPGPDVLGDGGPRWPMFQFDAAHTGNPRETTGPGESATEDWATLAGERIDGSPAVASGTVFLGAGNRLYAVDAASGDTRWRVPTDGTVRSTPAIGDEVVYAPGGTTLYAVDGRGATQWRYEVGSSITADPVVTPGGLLVAGQAGLQALESGGEPRWQFEQPFDDPPERESLSTPAVGPEGSTVYVGGNFAYGQEPQFRHGRMYALDPDDGTRRWTVEVEDNVSTPTVGDGLVFFGTRYGTLEAVTPDTGDREWHLEVGGDVVSSPAVADGTCYVGADAIYAVDAASGDVRWQVDLPEATYWSNSSPAVVDGVVYVGSGVLGREGRVHALDADDGTERWREEFDEPVFSSPAVVDGGLYVVDDRLRSFTATD